MISPGFDVIALPRGPSRKVYDTLLGAGFPANRAARLAAVVDRQRSEFNRWALVQRLLKCSAEQARENMRSWGYR